MPELRDHLSTYVDEIAPPLTVGEIQDAAPIALERQPEANGGRRARVLITAGVLVIVVVGGSAWLLGRDGEERGVVTDPPATIEDVAGHLVPTALPLGFELVGAEEVPAGPGLDPMARASSALYSSDDLTGPLVAYTVYEPIDDGGDWSPEEGVRSQLRAAFQPPDDSVPVRTVTVQGMEAAVGSLDDRVAVVWLRDGRVHNVVGLGFTEGQLLGMVEGASFVPGGRVELDPADLPEDLVLRSDGSQALFPTLLADSRGPADRLEYQDPSTGETLVIESKAGNDGLIPLIRLFLPGVAAEPIEVRGQPGLTMRLADDEFAAGYWIVWIEPDGRAVLVAIQGELGENQISTLLDGLEVVDGEAWAELVGAAPRRTPEPYEGPSDGTAAAAGWLLLDEEEGSPVIGVTLWDWTRPADAPDSIEIETIVGDGGEIYAASPTDELTIFVERFPPAYVFGAASPETATVEIVTDTGQRVGATTGPPRRLDLGSFPVEFFIAEIDPAATEVTVTSFDADGAVLAERTAVVIDAMTEADLAELEQLGGP